MTADVPMLIEARGISKQFGGVEVLSDVDLDLHAGEIHALLGENGAGKSTFAKILAGVHRPTRGTLRLNGAPIQVSSPIAAQKLGIALIHQEPVSFPDLSVAENIVMGRQGGGLLSRVPWAEIMADARRHMEMLGVSLDVARPMRGLSIANQQMVEIARALASDSRLIIMDEPTAALGVKESRRVLELILDVKSRGIPIVLISHNMPHVFEVCDRIHIHRLGKRLCVIDPKQFEMSDAVAFMTGAKEPPADAVAA